MKRLFLALAMVGLVAGCAPNPSQKPPEHLETLAYKNEGPTSLTLYTMVNRRSGAGAHTSLQVNASQKVLFDPAGSFKAEGVVRSGDVLYGFNPTLEKVYTGAHARSTHFVRKVTIPVPPEVAEMALMKVKANGPVNAAYCAASTSAILSTLPGFTDIDRTFYPVKLEEQLISIPGVTTETVIEDD